MEIIKWILIAVAVIFSITFIIFAKKTKSVLKTLLLFAASGVAVLLILYFLKPYLGLQISLNPVTVIVSSTLGVPGIIGLVIAPMFF